MRLNSHSRLHLILALQEAIEAGADEALMLDADGHVSSCNSTNFFFVAGGTVCTSTGSSCFNGITRGLVIDLCRENGVALEVGDFSLADVYARGRGVRHRHVRRDRPRPRARREGRSAGARAGDDKPPAPVPGARRRGDLEASLALGLARLNGLRPVSRARVIPHG